jgi:hypothetical protein
LDARNKRPLSFAFNFNPSFYPVNNYPIVEDETTEKKENKRKRRSNLKIKEINEENIENNIVGDKS